MPSNRDRKTCKIYDLYRLYCLFYSLSVYFDIGRSTYPALSSLEVTDDKHECMILTSQGRWQSRKCDDNNNKQYYVCQFRKFSHRVKMHYSYYMIKNLCLYLQFKYTVEIFSMWNQ